MYLYTKFQTLSPNGSLPTASRPKAQYKFLTAVVLASRSQVTATREVAWYSQLSYCTKFQDLTIRETNVIFHCHVGIADSWN